jgi:hypothetical protein
MIIYQTQTINIPDGFNLIAKDQNDNNIYLKTNDQNELRISDNIQKELIGNLIIELKKMNIQLSDITGNQISNDMTDIS